jgi:CTP:molybdopterin cytidylyltransferase MocA
VKDNFAGVILAAGKSERFGASKIVVDWQGEPLIRFVARQVISFDLSPVIIVLGAVIQPAVNALDGLPVKIVVNRRFQSGIGTSFSTGIRSLPTEIEGAFVFLGDQPLLSRELVKTMVDHSNEADVIVPTIDGVPGHPVLWKRQTFSRIRQLYVGETGKSIQNEFRCYQLAWKDPNILVDIDTKEDYKKLVNMNRKL